MGPRACHGCRSPAIDAGADHPDAPASAPSSVEGELVPNKTEKPIYDYFGTVLSGKVDIGASEYVEKIVVDKSELEEAIENAKEIDADKFTADSYAKRTEAIQDAEAVLADETASQARVDEAVKAIEDAIAGLIEIGSGNGDPDKPGSGNTGSGDKDPGKTDSESDSAKTGDHTPVMVYVAIAVLSLAAVCAAGTKVIRKRRKR